MERIDDQYSDFNPNPYYTEFNGVTHVRCTQPASDELAWYRSINVTYTDWVVAFCSNISRYARENGYISMDFVNDNAFELIPFILDWDGTLALFSKKLIREASYGTYRWGILPLISDVRSVWATLTTLNGGLERAVSRLNRERISTSIPIHYVYKERSSITGISNLVCEVSGSARFSGKVAGGTFYSQSAMDQSTRILLDELGLYPDLRTLWDVLPLSFVVDYFVPVGDWLESLHPRGWWNPTFHLSEGGVSVKGSIDRYFEQGPNKRMRSKYKFYQRTPGVPVLGARPPETLEWSCPTPRQLLDSLYLAITHSR
jgi:hypothetical protein